MYAAIEAPTAPKVSLWISKKTGESVPGKIPPSQIINIIHPLSKRPTHTSCPAFSSPHISLIKSVHRNVSGYGKAPTATTIGQLPMLPSVKKRLKPRILSIPIVPRNRPARIRNARSRRRFIFKLTALIILKESCHADENLDL